MLKLPTPTNAVDVAFALLGSVVESGPQFRALITLRDEIARLEKLAEAHCAECGEVFPCSDSKRTDLRGAVRALHVKG